jgi:hypothetical protein
VSIRAREEQLYFMKVNIEDCLWGKVWKKLEKHKSFRQK